MKKKILALYIALSIIPLAGCSARAEIYDPANSDVVTAWNYLMQQPTGNKSTDEVLAEYEALPQPDDSMLAAQIWALAVKHRNGYAQYALMGDELREQKRMLLDAAGWQTGVSSPWIESFDIYGRKGDYSVDFLLNSSTGSFGSFSVKITVDAADGGPCRITGIEQLKGDPSPYIY